MSQELIVKLIYEFKYQEALELIKNSFEEGESNLDLLAYSCVCGYIVEGTCLESLSALTEFIAGNEFEYKKVKKNTKTLTWIFDTINDNIHDNTLILHESIDDVSSGLLIFKKALPTSINIDVSFNKFKNYLLNAKRELDNQEVDKNEEKIEEQPKESISTGLRSSSKLSQLFKKIELCMELVNQNRLFEAALFYQDIQDKLTRFDPIEYFPEVFVPFYRNLSKSYAKMQKFIDTSQDTLEWHIAVQMYRSSPEALVSGGEIFSTDELNNTHDVTEFIRESRSILPTMGVINKKEYSRIANEENSERLSNSHDFDQADALKELSSYEENAYDQEEKDAEEEDSYNAHEDSEDNRFDFEFD
ncbi:hypothetical protein AVI51_01530 [Piscirickettsia salmonis]|uniref:Uncharacterized protein n=1 Tax=Piscirickettsia salmonis TaxID=1238 RepID=A0A9Q6LTH4_PISSA|nr:type VI secretion system protein IglI family protein [Piscirickettsia salmonis]ALA24740.1 hypothetical protein KW89_1272 [Piscirickettsia salmonis]APS45070.1 hypothetical protein AVI48_12260 [Piscirickettsia salmonis]APS52870.1 hypothetical protein AVI51_01530 [Piscirickettsia salmonis]APS56295.1 hypothetical protein AVI52_02995 [Piscirickettsia salmonis]ERL63244.1 hypothetical protein K661_00400 [Piscirickettsia salmonis LF-89 = ATCC VR-1361]